MKTTPAQKAKELYDRYIVYSSEDTIDKRDRTAKKCALILVEEVIDNLEELCVIPLGTYSNPKIDYWKEVEQKLQSLQ